MTTVALPPAGAGPETGVQPGVQTGVQPDLADRYRRAMRSHAAGVVVITTVGAPLGRTAAGTAAAPRPVGFCASSLVSVSAAPPMVAFSVQSSGESGRAWSRAAGGLVHLLHDGQESLARTFATPGLPRFAGPHRWQWSADGFPELEDRLALLSVRVTARHPAGDHLLVVATVTRVTVDGDPRWPLAYHAGGFRRLLPSTPARHVGVDTAWAAGQRGPRPSGAVSPGTADAGSASTSHRSHRP